MESGWHLHRRESSVIEPLPIEKKEEKTEKAEGKDKSDASKPAARQIWMISPEGGEAWQLTKFETDVASFHWSRDGKSIAFTAKPPEGKAQKDRKEKYSDYEVIEKDMSSNSYGG